MLQFVSNRPKQIELVAVHDIVLDADQAIRPLCEEKGVTLVTDANKSTMKVSAEKTALINSLIAVLENALKVSSEGQSIQLSLMSDKQRCQILIQDQGPGIPKDILDSLFEPFLSGHSTGTGLGLAIAKNAIEAHRGSITVENTNPGARFTINLPYIAEL
jgi:signal transduction histidine kinase